MGSFFVSEINKITIVNTLFKNSDNTLSASDSCEYVGACRSGVIGTM